ARGHPRFHIVDYHRLVTDPDQVQAELMAAIPHLSARRRFSRYHLAVTQPHDEWVPAMREIRPVSTSGLGGWRRRLSRLKGQIDRHGDIADDLIALGYEKDRSWMTLLNGVEPDLAPSVNAEALSLRRRLKSKLPRFRDMVLYYWRNRPLSAVR
ncbi:hypothetical protein LTR94_025951, partial [Friedmanniomyces endolithicus]